MDIDEPRPAADGAELSKSPEKSRKSTTSPALSLDILDLPTADFEDEQNIEDIIFTSPPPHKDAALPPSSDDTITAIEKTTAPANIDAESDATSPAGNIIAEINKDDEPGLAPPPKDSVIDDLASARGQSLGPEDADGKREAVVSSLRQKEANTALSTPASSLSSIPDLPTSLQFSPPTSVSRFYPTRAHPTEAAAESSAQASRRAQKPPAAKVHKTKPTPSVSTRSTRSTPMQVTKALPARKAAKRTRDDRDKDEDELDEEEEKAPVVKRTRSGKRSADEVDEPLKTVDEADVDEKPVGRGLRRKAEPKPVRTKKKPAKGKQKSDAEIRESSKGKTREKQGGTCIRARYAKWGKCIGCTSKSGGEGCRFQDFRQFPVDPKTGEITGPGFFESTDLLDQPAALPFDFSVPLTNDHLRRIDESAAPNLLPLITRELRHVVKNKAIKRAVDSANDRSYCDFCSCTIFAGYFVCKTCGRDYCLSCERYFSDASETMGESPWHLVPEARQRLLKCLPPPGSKQPTHHFRGNLQPVSAFSEEELKAHWLALAEFVAKGQEEKADWANLFGYSKEEASELDEEIERFRKEYQPSADELDRTPPTPIDLDALYTKFTRPGVPLPVDPANLRAESHKFMRISSPDKVDNSAFGQIWAKGEPIVVDGVGKNFKLDWTPDEMISQFGKEPCDVSDCERDVKRRSTIRDFFESFKDRDNRNTKEISKVQDWPAAEGFQKKHPGLYEDFSGALPVPDYTQQNGSNNLYAHFPRGPTKPDIGPKMYNAFAGKEAKGGHGSTRLHMDVADAINIMLFASPCVAPTSTDVEAPPTPPASAPAPAAPSSTETEPTALPTVDENDTDIGVAGPGPSTLSNRSARTKSRSLSSRSSTRPSTRGKQAATAEAETAPTSPAKAAPTTAPSTAGDPAHPGCAVWDVFRAEDADKLRTFLARKFAKSKVDFTDPIHSQMFYLDAALRKELFDTMGVASFRIYQYPGQAVFIPAGCAHQVCNLADCIKIAMDFVSPHNISRCQQLTQDFRKENFVKVWKDDVLQLYNILWFAWLSSRETRERRRKEKETEANERNTTPAEFDQPQTILSASGSTFGRGLTSSVRDDPASGLRLDTHPIPPPTLASAAAATPPPAASSPAGPPSDPTSSLVAKLLDAALAAPDAEPPEEARPPPAAASSRWGQKNAHAGPSTAASAIVGRKRTRASMMAGGEDREATPIMSLGALAAIKASGRRVNKASDAFKTGVLPMDYAMEMLQHQMGQGGDIDGDGMVVGV